MTTPPVDVTAVASTQVNLTKTVQGSALLDLPTTYRLRINVPNDPGALDISGISVSTASFIHLCLAIQFKVIH